MAKGKKPGDLASKNRSVGESSKEDEKKAIKNPHDRFFKSAMEHRGAALELFEKYMPEDLKSYALMDQYEKINASFLDASLDEQVTDATFRIPMDFGGDLYLYQYQFVEHQRRVRLDMPVRELELKAKIARYHMNRYNTREIPLIRMIVIYNGKEAYTGPRHLWEMTTGSQEIAKRIWALSYKLIDLSEETLDEYYDLVWLQVIFTMLKHIDDSRLLEELIKIGYNMEMLAQEIGGMELLKSAFTYAYEASEHVTPSQTAKVIREQIGQRTGGAAVTAAEMLIEEGRKEGRKEGHREGHYEAKREAAFNMFSRNCDLDFVADVQSLTAEQVLNLKAEWDQLQES